MASPDDTLDRFNVEYTDTFGGEANYSWVHRETIEVSSRASQRTIMRLAKRAVGLTGIRGRTFDSVDNYEFRPYGSCTVMFVTYDDCAD